MIRTYYNTHIHANRNAMLSQKPVIQINQFISFFIRIIKITFPQDLILITLLLFLRFVFPTTVSFKTVNIDKLLDS